MFPWPSDRPGHGGFSAIEVEEGGTRATLLIDTGWLLTVRIDRNAAGGIAAVRTRGGRYLSPPPDLDYKFDTEGLALDGRRGYYVSTEGPARLLHYNGPDAPPRILATDPEFPDLPENRGLEGLARAADGALWTLPERVTGETLDFLVLCDGTWRKGPSVPAGGGFVPVGLDFDDAGRLYLLERQFDLPFRFRARVRRFTFEGDRVAREEEFLSSRSGQYDNLEGLSVWRDRSGRLRVTLVSDDNFLPIQQTEFVEFAVPD